MVIKHDESKKMKRNLIDKQQMRATSIYITMPKCEVQGKQTAIIFGQKYPGHFNSFTTKVLEPSTKKRRQQKAYRRPSKIHGYYAFHFVLVCSTV